ncbi:MAG: sigma-70 family RNA polymerase sigma factor [Pseudomonadota bacterium]
MARESHNALQSSRSAFLAELFSNFRAELVERLRGIYGEGPPEPEDIAQVAFEQMAAMQSHHHIENPKAFLFKVALNAGRRAVGKHVATQEFLREVLDRDGEKVEKISPERLYENRESLNRLDSIIRTLSVQQREILIRSRIRGETYQEISANTGWSIATISRHLGMALERLAADVEVRSQPSRSEAQGR